MMIPIFPQTAPPFVRFIVALFALIILSIAVDYALLGVSLPDTTTPVGMIAILSRFAADFVVIWLVVRYFYDHGLGVLFYQGFAATLRKFLICFAIFAFITGGSLYLAFDPSLDHANLPFEQWVVWFPIALPFIMIQISAEEVIFRGFLQQKLRGLSRSPWVWLVLPSVIFGVLHYDPSQPDWDAWWIMGAAGLLGIFLADLTYRTGNLGAAMGFHFANNVISLCFFAPDDVLNGLALYVVPIMDDGASAGALYIVRPIVLLVLYFLILMVGKLVIKDKGHINEHP